MKTLVLTHNGFTLYDSVSPDDVLRSVWLFRDQEFADEMIVEAELRIVRHGPAPGFAGFVEYRQARAVVRPLP